MVHAADIQVTGEPLCAFKLEGKLIPGNHDRLASLIARNRPDPLDERTGTLCLSSPGGSYDEGLKISEVIYLNDLSTLVADGSKCFSACALIFMAGVLPDQTMPYRKLSAGGVVGFHAPYLSLTNGTYSKEQVESAAQAMRLAILGLMQLSSKQTKLSGGEFIKKSLIAKLLDKGPQEALFIKTVSDAARWDVEIYDADEQFPTQSKIDEMKNLCRNFHYGNMDEPVPSNRDFSLKVEKYTSKISGADFRVLVRDVRTEDTVCEVYPHVMGRIPKVLFTACSYDYWTSKSFGDCREYKTRFLFGKPVPGFFIFPPGTVLKAFRDGR
jgi:hypothetical protein